MVFYKPAPIDGGPLEVAFFEAADREDAARQAVNQKTTYSLPGNKKWAKDYVRRCLTVLGAGEFGVVG